MLERAGTEGPVERGTIRSGPFELSYVAEGAGPPALVIGSAVYYPRTFSAALRRHLRLIFIDHRGFGRALGAAGPADYAFDTILDDVDAMRRHLGLGRTLVIGHSGHGQMALAYAKRYPQHVSHLALIASGPSHSAAHAALAERHWQEAVCPERKARYERAMAQLPADIAAAPERRFVAFCIRAAARQWYDPAFDPAPLWEGVEVNMAMFDHVFGEVLRDIDVAAGIEALPMPVFLGLGRFDYLVAPALAWETYRAAFRDLTVRVFDRSSHTPQIEEPDLFDAELLGWLGRTGL